MTSHMYNESKIKKHEHYNSNYKSQVEVINQMPKMTSYWLK